MKKPLRELIDILSPPIAAMVYTITWTAITNPSTNNYVLSGICNLHHVQPGTNIVIDGNTYAVIKYNDVIGSLVVNGTVAVTVYSTNLTPPTFYYGTATETEAELANAPMNLKAPIIYLMELTNEDFDNYSGTSIERVSKCQLFFLANANLTLTTDVLRVNSVKPMLRLASDFIDMLEDNPQTFATAGKGQLKYNLKKYTKFAIYIQGKGANGKQYFSENYSGYGLTIPISILKDYACCDSEAA